MTSLLRRSGLLLLASLVLAQPSLAQRIADADLFGKSAAAAQQALEHYGEWNDEEAKRRVVDIGYLLAGHSGYSEFPFSFFLVDMREPNAFALPGGQIFITRGMYELGLSDDQLAGLLGHEIAHVTLRHGVKMQRRATLLNVLSQALLVGVILASGDEERGVPYGRTPTTNRGQSTSAGRVQGAAAASVILGELLLRSYSREFEDEADEEGQRLAAAAGFQPVGAAELFSLMESRLPQSRKYGYWRTHPFFTDRVEAAEVRGDLLQVQEPRDVTRYRTGTQATLLAFDESALGEDRAKVERLNEKAALASWPRGETAERLRLERLHRLRDEALGGAPLSRDYGRVLRAYEEEREIVASLTPESPFLRRLDAEMNALERDLAEIYPQAVETFEGGIYQTPFLEVFLSNFPDAPEAPEAALQLARAYSRLGRESEAVDRYLGAWRADPEGEVGEQAVAGLKALAPSLDRLAALEQLARQDRDSELAATAETRLDELAGKFSELPNGAEYLRRFPDADHAETVATRLDGLAEKLYGEVVLYQGVGDNMKALERIQQILTHAPLSPAAERIRERAVLDS